MYKQIKLHSHTVAYYSKRSKEYSCCNCNKHPCYWRQFPAMGQLKRGQKR